MQNDCQHLIDATVVQDTIKRAVEYFELPFVGNRDWPSFRVIEVDGLDRQIVNVSRTMSFLKYKNLWSNLRKLGTLENKTYINKNALESTTLFVRELATISEENSVLIQNSSYI